MATNGRGRVRVEPTQKRIRAQIGGVTVADSSDVMMVWEIPYFPTYYFPATDVAMDLLADSGETKRSPSRGTATLHDVTVGPNTVPRAALIWDESKIEDVQGFVSFDWASMDAWFEEDEEVYYHARDPYTRVDILQSSRHIRVEVDGVIVADTDKARILFETGLPARYYMPKTDVRMDLLTPSDTETHCPYKGTARYWTITVNDTKYDDLVWGYDAPFSEAAGIAGFVSFWNEKLDIYVDGELEAKPRTKF